MPGNVRWNGDALKRQIHAELGRRLDACAIVVENHAKVLISVDGTARVATVKVDSKGRKRKGTKLVYGANPSKPGEPPHVQTGRLRASVAHERVGLVARVGTSLLYGRWLELGTVHMAARPWLRRALFECSAQIRAILGRPMP